MNIQQHLTTNSLTWKEIELDLFRALQNTFAELYRPSRDQFCCRACGYAAPADNVAAENIRRAAVNQPNAAAN
ncbi:hypothetical protein B9L23_01070 [Parageobacillus galactosidasius]|uniref:Transposase n=1 Tax=Parageobacillus galactosidasius TaxID=883812 RepID=A0A226QM45_9BACL|nr:hypothetical protein [Parageobacillus galactosidasius]OXB93603.1 hypothetical protein B9L23_01070 [Parageobacillus galactosidasius]